MAIKAENVLRPVMLTKDEWKKVKETAKERKQSATSFMSYAVVSYLQAVRRVSKR